MLRFLGLGRLLYTDWLFFISRLLEFQSELPPGENINHRSEWEEWSIRGQYLDHVITFDQSEARSEKGKGENIHCIVKTKSY